jgi:mRNA-degrading endonuclease RelE of RelBE toxin-antitoxin system
VKYKIAYTIPTERHLRALSARDRRAVLDTVDRQLVTQPEVTAHNRKRMRPNPLAEWELRIGHLRVYYDVEEDPEPMVLINAVGIQRGNRVFIAGEEVELS